MEINGLTFMNIGLAHCCHHDTHYEFCYDYLDRVAHIKANKPVLEIELRLKLFQLIPEDRLPLSLRKLIQACEKVYQAYVKVDQAYNKAYQAYVKEYQALNEAIKIAMPELDKLHAELFPDCPWNGKTIFPEA